jgi:Ala-tRNA(Pro) deacylase
MAEAAYEAIVQRLHEAGVDHRTFEHEAVRTSEEAAAVRGTPLEQGAKALVLECGEGLILAVLSAAGKVDFKALKEAFDTRRVQMAPAERVREVTGCEPGGVPPFGDLFGLPTVVDPSLLENEWIDFNAGERTRSVEMRALDYVRLSGAQVLSFCKR